MASWLDWIQPAASLAGAVLGWNGASKAANAQVAGNNAAIDEQRREFDTLLSLTAPYRDIGYNALNEIGTAFGYPSGASGSGYRITPGGGVEAIAQPGGAGSADYSNFFSSPDYRFALNEGVNTVQNSAAAQGGLYSGNAFRGLNDYAQGKASEQIGNWLNRRAALAGIGQTATNEAGNAALTTGANVGNALIGAGNARASGIVDQSNQITNLINQLAEYYGKKALGGSSSAGSGVAGVNSLSSGGSVIPGAASSALGVTAPFGASNALANLGSLTAGQLFGTSASAAAGAGAGSLGGGTLSSVTGSAFPSTVEGLTSSGAGSTGALAGSGLSTALPIAAIGWAVADALNAPGDKISSAVHNIVSQLSQSQGWTLVNPRNGTYKMPDGRFIQVGEKAGNVAKAALSGDSAAYERALSDWLNSASTDWRVAVRNG